MSQDPKGSHLPVVGRLDELDVKTRIGEEAFALCDDKREVVRIDEPLEAEPDLRVRRRAHSNQHRDAPHARPSEVRRRRRRSGGAMLGDFSASKFAAPSAAGSGRYVAKARVFHCLRLCVLRVECEQQALFTCSARVLDVLGARGARC